MKILSTGTLVLLLISVLTSGCASIFGSSRFPVTLNSTPNGASFLITNKRGDTVFDGKTPSVVTLKSYAGYFQKQSYLIKFHADGFNEKTYPIEFRINGFYFCNILVGGALGMLIIDPLTGCMWTLPSSLNHINARLTILNAQNTPSLKIINVSELPADLQKQMIPIQ